MPHDVETTLFYYKCQNGMPPETNDIELLLGNKDADARQVTIRDIRGNEHIYSLHKNGFQVVKHSIQGEIFKDQESIKSIYYPEIVRLLKECTGAKNVVILSHQIRSASATILNPNTYLSSPQGPARRVHIDQSTRGAEQLIGTVMSSEDAGKVMSSSRWIVLNAWCPIKSIRKDPLAVTDATSVPDNDLVPLKRVMPNGKEAENYLVKGGDPGRHKWYYLNGQQSNEVLVFKIYDSDLSCPARRTAHVSFTHPGTEGMPTRESIEVRAVVY